MRGKLLIVEDEPIVALDLKQEVEQLGCEVIGVAESADEALVAAGVHRPDLALMDVRIVGSVDGIQTAGLLRAAYRVPVVFLTSYSDETTISRAAREMPYGYLTKPFQSGELKATLQVALHKARVDARQSAAHRAMEVVSAVSFVHGRVVVSFHGTKNRGKNQLSRGTIVSYFHDRQRAVSACRIGRTRLHSARKGRVNKLWTDIRFQRQSIDHRP